MKQNLEVQVTNAQQQLTKSSEVSTRYQQYSQQLEDTIKSLQQHLAESAEETKQHRDVRQQLESQVASLQQQLADSSVSLEKVEKYSASTQSEVQALREEVSVLSEARSELQVHNTSLQQELSAARQELSVVAERLRQTESADTSPPPFSPPQQSLPLVTSTPDTDSTNVQKLREKLTEMQKAAKKKDAKVMSLTKQLDKSRQEVSSLSQQLEQAMEELSSLQPRVGQSQNTSYDPLDSSTSITEYFTPVHTPSLGAQFTTTPTQNSPPAPFIDDAFAIQSPLNSSQSATSTASKESASSDDVLDQLKQMLKDKESHVR